MVWRGVIIEESLEDKTLLGMIRIVETKELFLEEEEEKGLLNFHNIEVEDRDKDTFIQTAKDTIKQGWYIHICKESKMAIIFKGMVFELDKSEKEKLEAARSYALSIGIIEEQLPSESLIEKPFD